MDPELCARLRELHALASDGILEAAEYAQLKAEALAAHRQDSAEELAARRQMRTATLQVHLHGASTQQHLLDGLVTRQAAVTEARLADTPPSTSCAIYMCCAVCYVRGKLVA